MTAGPCCHAKLPLLPGAAVVLQQALACSQHKMRGMLHAGCCSQRTPCASARWGCKFTYSPAANERCQPCSRACIPATP
jgi:hypothetical protein